MLGTMHFYNALLAVIIYSNDSRKPGNRYARRVDTFPRCQISRYLDFSLITRDILKLIKTDRFSRGSLSRFSFPRIEDPHTIN